MYLAVFGLVLLCKLNRKNLDKTRLDVILFKKQNPFCSTNLYNAVRTTIDYFEAQKHSNEVNRHAVRFTPKEIHM